MASSVSSSGNVASTGSVSSSSSNVSTRVASSQYNPSSQASDGAGRNERGNPQGAEAYSLLRLWHIKSRCPNKVRRVTPRDNLSEMSVDGGYVAKGLSTLGTI